MLALGLASAPARAEVSPAKEAVETTVRAALKILRDPKLKSARKLRVAGPLAAACAARVE
jgi:hypothetical protein